MKTNASEDKFSLTDLAVTSEQSLTPIDYPPGSVIFHEGEISENAYIIEKGRVQISVKSENVERVIAVLGAGELLGEMAALDKMDRSATATAMTDTEIIPISREQLRAMVDNSNPLMQMFLRTVLTRLRKSQNENYKNIDTKIQVKEAIPSENDDVILRHAFKAIRMEKSLRDAIKNREFQLYLQPIIDLKDDHIAGFESLIRWFSPQRGLVAPNDFIYAAEETGLIIPIGLWVLEEALHQLDRLQTRFMRIAPKHAPLFVSANVSTRQLANSDTIDQMITTINQTGVDPTHLKLEITEGSLMEDSEAALSGLNKLKTLGLSIAIDDFGTGYSSLAYLHRFPLDTMKIDGSFVRTMLDDPNSMAIVRSITNLSSDLNMDVVAEGIESLQEVESLKKLGCEFGQGYLYAKPMTSVDAMALLNNPVLNIKK